MAFEVAQALRAPLDVVVVRKLGVPFQSELAMGAIGEDGALVVDTEVLRGARISNRELAVVEARERAELERRVRRYREGRPPVPVAGRTVVIVDDGIATGSTARAACRVIRARGAAKVVLAVPVAPQGWVSRMGGAADEYISVETPSGLFAVGQWYADFSQTSDEEVASLLSRANGRPELALPPVGEPDVGDPPGQDAPLDNVSGGSPSASDTEPDIHHQADVELDVDVPVGALHLQGHLAVPARPRGMVLFAHGSGSSRHSPRNRWVAATLNRAGFGTLLFDLLMPEEEILRESVFDVELLASRLAQATRWLRTLPLARGCPIGYFGASTGAAAALWAAADAGDEVRAVVSRGGRPDLAGPRLPYVGSPTLLIVGARDEDVLRLNKQALRRLACAARLEVVPGATHLFSEPGALGVVASLARGWFLRHLESGAQQPSTRRPTA